MTTTPSLSGACVMVLGCRILLLIIVYLWDIRGPTTPFIKDLGFGTNEVILSTRIVDDQILGMSDSRLVCPLLYNSDFRRGQN